jgi:hypothetical protein
MQGTAQQRQGAGEVLLISGGQYGVGKRGTLEEDSSLGSEGINMLYIDLGRLVGRRSCTISLYFISQ